MLPRTRKRREISSHEREVGFVFYGPDERALGDLSILDLEEAYSQDGVTIYKVYQP